MIRIAGTQEIGMQRMHGTVVDGCIGRLQRLPEHLTTEHSAVSRVAALPFESIRIEALELQYLQYIGEQRIHMEAVGVAVSGWRLVGIGSRGFWFN